MSSKNIISKMTDAISDAFSFGSKGVIGIDIGLSAIKLAEVSQVSEGNYKVNRYVSIPLKEGALIEDEIQKEDEILEALQLGIKKLKSSYSFACVGISGPNTLFKRLQLASGTLEEIEDQVTWETEQYLPFPIDEGNISFSVVGENQGGGVDVIVGAAKRTVVSTFKELVERSNLKVKIIDLSAAAVVNVFENVLASLEGAQSKTWILIDIGTQKTHFIIYKNGMTVFYKEISMGGLTITEEIQRQMGVNYEEAESLKIHGDGSGNIPEEIVNLTSQVAETFLTELKKTVDFWVNSTSEEAFDGCMLTGGSALIPGFAEALQDLFATEVQILNPFSSMTYNQNNIEEEAIGEISLRGVCAIGLGMRSYSK